MHRITAASLLLATGLLSSQAQIYTWDPNRTGGSGGSGNWNLNSTANWYNGSADVAWTDNSVFGTNGAVFGGTAGTVNLANSLSASNLQFSTSGYTLSGSGTLTLGAGGINAGALASGSTTVSTPLLLPASQQLWQVGSGAALAVNGVLTRSLGASVDFTVNSSASLPGISSTSAALTNDATGVIGGWATVNDTIGIGSTWAANDGSGNITNYSGYTQISATASSTQSGAGAATQNWITGSFGGANYITTLSGSATINSLVVQGDFSVPNGGTLTLGNGGLILSGISRWVLDAGGGNIGTAVLTSGSATGELFVHTPDNAIRANSSAAGNWRIWPQIQNNGSTPLILVKDGPGCVSLQNASGYTGGTIINNGILDNGYDDNTTEATTALGYGTITINSSGILEMGFATQNANTDYFITNSIVLNGGKVLADDGHQHISGPISVSPAGATFGSTYDGGAAAGTGNKGFFVDGLVSGSGPVFLQQAYDAGECDAYGNAGGNTFNSSFVCFSNNANTYSGTITIVPYTTAAGAGSYLAVNGSTALQYATVDVQNNTGNQRFAGTALIFNTGLGSATLGGLTDSGNVILNGFREDTYALQTDAIALTVGNNNSSTMYSGVISGGGSLTKVGTGTLTLSGAETYTGYTSIAGGTLALIGSIVSTNITVAAGATFDVSATSLTLAGYEVLYGAGTVNGSLSTSSGSKIYMGTNGYATNTINNNLTLASGTTLYYSLGTSTAGPNGLLKAGGTVTLNNNIIHIAAPSTSANLQAADYPLITAVGGVSGSPGGIAWDVLPANAAHYSLVTSANAVTLHYTANTAPTGSGSATPAIAVRNQNVLLTVTTTNGSSGAVTSVTVDASSIGGSATTALVSAGGNVWTNTVTVAASTAPGNYPLPATITDTVPLSSVASIALAVVAGNDVWDGLAGNAFFDSNLNWTNKTAPGYVGDSLEFAGTANLSPDMDQNYTVTGITFDSGAGSFNIGSAESDTLTLSGSGALVNNSANPQTLNVSIADSGGGLTKGGAGVINLTANNTYTGDTIVKAGTLNLSGTVANNSFTEVGSAAGNAILDISGSLTQNNFFVGNTNGAVGAVYQTAGTVTVTAGSGGDLLDIGNIAGGFGYYEASGGTVTANGIAVGGENYVGTGFTGTGGNGIMDINGATVNDTGWLVMARGATAEAGVLNVFSGSLAYAGGGLVVDWGSSQTSIINILGGTVISAGNEGVGLGTSGNGILNLNGGLLNASIVSGNFGATYGQVNFNGGTLQVNTSTTTAANFLHVSSATIYSGGATIDNNSQATTITQPFLAPAGNGVVGIGSFTGGAGYIAPPIVTITPGSGDTTGTGATAIAQINPLTGVVTNVIITCPGVNYTATPVFTLSGGGATTPATITGQAPTANASGGLTSVGSGGLTLGGACTYTGSTVVSNGTLFIGASGSINDSTNIIVEAGATFDVTAPTSYAVAAGQTLSGFGTVNGSVGTVAGAVIAAGAAGVFGTNTFNNNLTLVSGAVGALKLGPAYNGQNDQIVVSGTLTANGNSIYLTAPSSSANLDTTANYVLMTSANTIAGSFATAPIWVVAPANAAHYSIVTSGTTVTLHYNAAASAPSVTASANPTTLSAFQKTLITANVTPGSGSITSVTIDLTPLGGSVVSLVRLGATSTYTNTVTIPASALPGSAALTVTATDSTPLSGATTVTLNITPSSDVWNGLGANENWSTGGNWVGGIQPAFSGASLTFAGTTGLTPNMDTNYSVPSLTFSNNAGSFNISSANSSTLTLSGNGSIINNSANLQTLNVTIADSGGGLTKGGTGAVTLAGNNTYSGSTVIAAGTVNLTGTAASTNNSVVGSTATNSVLTISGSGSFAPYFLLVGNVTNSTGAIYQTGGTLSVNSASGFDNLCLGNVPGSFGYYFVDGGTATIDGLCIGGEANNGNASTFDLAGNGVMDVYGGTVTDTGWLLLARNNNSTNGSEIGVLNMYGGYLSYAGGGIVGPWDTGETGIINMMGGDVTNTAAVGVYLGDTGYLGILNLDGGILAADVVEGYNGPSYAPVSAGLVNFNGGTLQASAGNTAFIAVTTAYVYGGGAIVDNQGYAITIGQPLLAPTGKGVNGYASFTPGAGYIASPIVQVVPGTGDTTGTGATAVAQVNLATGTVTNVIITCPGVNYTATPTFKLIGGGATTPATITGMAPTANTSGGFTALGSGVTSLSASNSYTGNTTVEAGTLELTYPVLAASSTVSVASGANLQLNFSGTNTVAGLLLNGVSQPAGVYNGATAPTYLTGAGSLQVGSSIPNTPTNITFSVSHGTMSLSWPANYLGWILQQQTNSLSAGLRTNWVDVAGSGSITATNITLSPAMPAVFYRLRHP